MICSLFVFSVAFSHNERHIFIKMKNYMRGELVTERRRFFYNGALLAAVGIAIRAVGMLFNAYITRTVGAEGIGLYTIIMTVYSFAITFATSGLSLTVTRLVAADIGENSGRGVRRILFNSTIYALIFSTAAALSLLFLSKYLGITVLSDSRTVLPLKILALSLIPIALSSLYGGYFVGVRRVANNAVAQVMGQIFKISVTVFFTIRYAPRGIDAAVIALAVSTTLTEALSFLVALVQYLIDKRRLTRERGDKQRSFYDVASMALPLAVSAYIRSALLTLEHVLIPMRLRKRGDSLSESLSAYGMLHGMALPLLILPLSPLSSFAGLLVPEFAESMAAGKGERMRRIANRALNVTLSYAVVLSVFLATFSEELGYVIYDSYGVGRYIRLLSPVIPIMYLDHVTDSVLKGIGEHVYSMWVNIIDSLLSVLLVFWLIPVMGIGGYAVVIVVMEGFNFILSATRLYKRIPFKINVFKSVLLPLLSAVLSSALCRTLFVMNGGEAKALWLIFKLIFSGAICFAAYKILRGAFRILSASKKQKELL